MAPKWSDETNLKFVELYKEQRCLWDQRDELYKNRNARETALVTIAEQMNILGFGAAEVKSKIKSFRGTFNIEYGKHRSSVKSGSGLADVYVPVLKWFDAMKEVMLKGTLTRDTNSVSDDPSEESLQDQGLLEEQVHQPACATKRSCPSDTVHPPSPKQSRLQMAEEAISVMKSLGKDMKVKDEFDVFGELVAWQLRKSTDARETAIAKQRINQVLFDLEMSSWNKNNPSSVSTSPSTSRLSDFNTLATG